MSASFGGMALASRNAASSEGVAVAPRGAARRGSRHSSQSVRPVSYGADAEPPALSRWVA